MIKFNYLIIVVSSLIPLLIGALWYHPKLFGTNVDKIGHRPYFYFLTFILSFFYSIAISYQVIHQLHFQSIFYKEVGFLQEEGEAYSNFKMIMSMYGGNFRTFQHGLFHGFLNSIFIILPILGIHSLFEGKSWRFILIHLGYWTLCSMIMGAIICQFY